MVPSRKQEVEMRYGIPLFQDRVAPRCTIADSLIVVTTKKGLVISQRRIPMEHYTWIEIAKLLVECGVEALICGGIDRESKENARSLEIAVIDNVACNVDELQQALRTGTLKPGYGFGENHPIGGFSVSPSVAEEESQDREESRRLDPGLLPQMDCIACHDRICSRGGKCLLAGPKRLPLLDEETRSVLDTAMDIALEEERTLCRLSEIVYFFLGMKYRRVGMAFCIDLLEPAEILTGVLRRFFEVIPVCCKIGGFPVESLLEGTEGRGERADTGQIACNPLGQAEVLNRLRTDVNIIVGLCAGVDCIFTRASLAPVTTLFVKDKSLANNPIGAIYSEYYLREAATARAR
jgi:uncharacterized metal-binding protein/predicted Fe-Mo cluster-binding NifX family protein